TFGTGIAIGSVPSLNYGYIFAIEYPDFSSKVLALNHPGGRVGIGTTTPDQTLTVNGNASKPGGGSWLAFSDERLKNINGRFTTGLRAVMKLQPIRYQYKPNNALNLNTNGEQYVGFGAQAVQKIIPEAVVKDSKGYLLVNNDAIIWTMLNAVKEQQAQIERQEKQIKQQQRQIDRLMIITVNSMRRRK
nr:tail fiber domain-containing protein [Acidobacteriota bacterium]